MEVLIEQMKNTIKKRPDNPDAWYAVCDALRDDKTLMTVDMESATNPGEFFQSIFPYAMKMADIVYTFETVPVYVLVKSVKGLGPDNIARENNDVMQSTSQKSMVITIRNEMIPDLGVQVFFSEEDAKKRMRRVPPNCGRRSRLYTSSVFYDSRWLVWYFP